MELIEYVRCPHVFAGLTLQSKDDVFIAVMGLTGAGKSTFISLCTQETIDIVGHGLSSCQ